MTILIEPCLFCASDFRKSDRELFESIIPTYTVFLRIVPLKPAGPEITEIRNASSDDDYKRLVGPTLLPMSTDYAYYNCRLYSNNNGVL